MQKLELKAALQWQAFGDRCQNEYCDGVNAQEDNLKANAWKQNISILNLLNSPFSWLRSGLHVRA